MHSNPKCWAKSLNDCDKQISKEHFISKNLLTPMVTVSGFSWCQEPKTISRETLIAPCLCATHNFALKDLDTAAKDLQNVRKAFDETYASRLRRTGTRNWPKFFYKLDGVSFSRWCFKAICGLRSLENWEPSVELVKYIFGQGSLDSNCGLGFQFHMGQKIGFVSGKFEHGSFLNANREVLGTRLQFEGMNFVCSWSTPLLNLTIPGSGFDILPNPKEILFTNKNLALQFDWTGTYKNEASPTIASLRRRYRE